mgnify:CR=1 FL=1
MLEIFRTVERGKFSRHDQKVLKRAQPTYGLALGPHLVKGEGDALERVVMVEAAIDSATTSVWSAAD